MNLLKEAIQRAGLWDFDETPQMTDGQKKQAEIEASFSRYNYKPLFVVGYDGEKNPGEIGDIVKYQPNYSRLRNRSWQFFLSTDVAQTIFRKYSFWIIGSGLKLQSEPSEKFLIDEGTDFNKEAFINSVEPRWKIFAKSKRASYNNQRNLHSIANEVHKNAIVGGDVLVIARVNELNEVKVQYFDGDNVRTPMIGGTLADEDKNRKVIHGIVFDENGNHVAYYVVSGLNEWKRIPAKDRFGNLVAWMIFGLSYRPDNVRGIPLLSAVMETVAKLDRYKEAAVGSAEERQKVAYSVEHKDGSTGETPLSRNLATSRGLDKNLSEPSEGPTGSDTANLIAKTTNKQAFNMPVGSQLKFHSSEMELGYKEFMMTNATMICATAQIPVEVAFSKYDSNFSASRAALKDWEHVIKVNREQFANDFYEPIYSLWLNIQVMTGKIRSQALADALIRNDMNTNDAIKNSRWLGQNVPHIDPVKEVQAERLKLGPLGANAPLTTPGQSTETLGTGDYEENTERFEEEVGMVDAPVQKSGLETIEVNRGSEDEND